MKSIIGLALVLLLGATALAARNAVQMYFLDGSTSTALAKTAACTTKWYRCDQYRYMSLYWEQYVNVGAGDSSQVKWDFQCAIRDTNHIDSELDTVRTVAIGLPVDTLGAERAFNVQFFAEIPMFIRAIGTGLTDNSDSTNLQEVFLNYDSGN